MRSLVFLPVFLLLMACTGPNIPLLNGAGQAVTPVVLAEQTAIPMTRDVIQTQTLAPLGQSPAANPAPPKAIPISSQESDCRAKGGRWGRAGKLVAMTCYIPAKDAGKSCSKQSDCSSQCLARSRTCAPIWPIFGCSEVLQNDGSVVKLCID